MCSLVSSWVRGHRQSCFTHNAAVSCKIHLKQVADGFNLTVHPTIGQLEGVDLVLLALRAGAWSYAPSPMTGLTWLCYESEYLRGAKVWPQLQPPLTKHMDTHPASRQLLRSRPEIMSVTDGSS